MPHPGGFFLSFLQAVSQKDTFSAHESSVSTARYLPACFLFGHEITTTARSNQMLSQSGSLILPEIYFLSGDIGDPCVGEQQQMAKHSALGTESFSCGDIFLSIVPNL